MEKFNSDDYVARRVFGSIYAIGSKSEVKYKINDINKWQAWGELHDSIMPIFYLINDLIEFEYDFKIEVFRADKLINEWKRSVYELSDWLIDEMLKNAVFDKHQYDDTKLTLKKGNDITYVVSLVKNV